MIGIRFLWYIIVFFCIVFTACNKQHNEVLKSQDYDLKLTKAKEYYNEGDYLKALPLFEELMTVYKGTKDVEDLYYFYPYCHYAMGDYIVSQFYFQNFLDYYPRSVHAEDARFMIPYCNYRLSPDPDLEQSYTQKAIEGFQLFTNAFPDSEKVAECNQLIDECRKKMEKKALKGAELYYNLGDYRASATALNNLLQDFPETEEREKVQFWIVRSYYLLAENSIDSKRLERYNLAVDAYLNLVDNYSQGKFTREAEKIYNSSLAQIDKIKSDD